MSSFSRQARLTSRHDFQVVFEKPKKVTRPHWQVLYIKNTLSHPRLGIIISKKFVKHAVARNRLRRLVRESFRQQLADMPAVDIVFLARRGFSQLDNHVIREQVDKVWQSLKV